MSSRTTPTSARGARILPRTVITPKNVRLTPASSTGKKSSILTSSDLNMAFSLPASSSKGSTSKRVELTKSPLTKAKSTLSVCPTPPKSRILQKASSLKSLTTPSYSLASSTSTPTTRRLLKPVTAAPSTPECFAKVSLETPLRRMDRSNLSLANASMVSGGRANESTLGGDGEMSSVKVAVRVRPMNTKELLSATVSNVVQLDGNEVVVFAGNTADNTAGVHHRYMYDSTFWSCNSEHRNYCGQEEVYNELARPLLDRAFEGYNTCLFAYGQTSSGKSYSMMGIDAGADDETTFQPQSEAGIIPRFCHELFQRLEAAKGRIEAEVEVSYFEIYNEKIHDLLSVTAATTSTSSALSTSMTSGALMTPNAGGAKKSLRVREHSIWGPYVVDLSTHPVDSHVALRNWLALGNSQRATAATGMNDKSSRSHSIFNIVLNLTEKLGDSGGESGEQTQTKRSKISLVDLAGSERVSFTGASGDRLKEGVSINKSLLTLGKVIAALSTGKKGFIPYRESVLTWLLRENLGGNSRTVMLATISPASIHMDETLATLRYACQARTIINRVKVNEDPHDKIIRELRAEVDRLQSLQQDFDRQQKRQSIEPRKIVIETSVDETEVKALRDELVETRQELAKAERSWLDRLKEAETVRKTEMKMLQKKGLALEFSVEQKQACLVNLAADPMLSGTLLYIIPAGKVRVGRMRPAAFDQPDIVLEGPLVAFDHCVIENEGRKLYIQPIAEDFETFINGELIQDRRRMYDGDRLVIGGSHYFRVANLNCEKRQERPVTGDNVPVDFQWAHQEIMAQQERKLREELETEKQVALQQIRAHQKAAEVEFEERLQSLEMEKFQIKSAKELLESEVAIYKRQNKRDGDELMSNGVYKSSYQSTLLEDIQRMMARPTKESLHQIQMKVKEATQRCRDFAAPYEFRQTQKADSLGIFHAVVTIIDRQRSKVAEWPPARLDVWLEMVRETDFDKQRLFDCVETVWMDWEEVDRLDESFGGESLNSSRIGLNLSAMKEKLLMVAKGSPQRPMSPLVIKSALKESGGKSLSEQKRQQLLDRGSQNTNNNNSNGVKKMLTYEEDNNNNNNKLSESKRRVLGAQNGPERSVEKKDRRLECIGVELKDLQQGTHRLRKLIVNGDAVEEVQKKALSKACQEIERQLAVIKGVLDRGGENKGDVPGEVVKTPKSVRFLLE